MVNNRDLLPEGPGSASAKKEVKVRGLNPGMVMPELVCVPGSKSLAIRALLCAGLARGTTELEGLAPSEDVSAALGVLKQSGVLVQELGPGRVRVTGRSPAAGEFWRASGPLDCGESGTLARLVTGIYAWCGEPGQTATVSARGSLLKRESAALFDCLRQSGVTCEFEGQADGWPVRISPAAVGETLMLQGPSSSQELSALLLPMGAHRASPRGRSVLVMGGLPSEPYAHMTLAVLKSFGAQVAATGAEWRVAGPLAAPMAEKDKQTSKAFVIEADASAAAVALAAACIGGGEVRVPGFSEHSSQGDLVILKYLRAFGCQAQQQSSEWVASGLPTHMADLDFDDCPDLAPVMVAVAGALALRLGEESGSCHFTSLDTLNGKECRRLQVLAAGLRALGIQARETEHSLSIGPGPGTSLANAQALVLDPQGDHRMAFAFALLGLVHPNLQVSNPACVSKSWPSFWEAMGAEPPS